MTDIELHEFRSLANAASDSVSLHPHELHRLVSEIYRLRVIDAAGPSVVRPARQLASVGAI